jgi:hypothetical protein
MQVIGIGRHFGQLCWDCDRAMRRGDILSTMQRLDELGDRCGCMGCRPTPQPGGLRLSA